MDFRHSAVYDQLANHTVDVPVMLCRGKDAVDPPLSTEEADARDLVAIQCGSGHPFPCVHLRVISQDEQSNEPAPPIEM